MICTSVTGDVSSSSIVPDRFSSEYVLIVTIEARKHDDADLQDQQTDQHLVDVDLPLALPPGPMRMLAR